jgi:integral membrane sensor domain MASE1/serine phosphatase RsbU (regulator of sigma subunit)
MNNRTRYVAMVLCLAAVYYGAAELGLSLAFETPSVSAVWAPTGIALAALVLFGLKYWPGVALGAFLANAWTGVPLLAVLGITAGNTLEALVGAYLLLRLTDFKPSLERVTDVVWLVALGAVLSTLVSATIGTGSLLAAGEIEGGDLGSVWRTWWLGDMGGDLLIAPALMVAFTHWPYARLPGGLVEAVALAVGIAGTVAFGFTREEPLTFLLLPLPILAAFRFRQPGAVAASLITAVIAIPLTEDMQGPFAGFAPDDRLLLAQLFVGFVSLTTLVLAAVISERQRAEDSIRYVADTLQESLLPASLPVIAGVQAAVEFRPVGERGIVGGDFYELIEGEDGSVGIAIGDALGKGAIAAADTALARYTLRTAAMHETEPSRILSVLNEAMLRQTSDHPCTVAYARLELNADGAMLTVSIGGHPRPLILRVDGTVEPIGYPAPPLGVRRGLNLTDHTARLAPGDALILYTDGLTDAFAPHRVVSPDDLAVALQPYAGGTATEIIEAASHAAVPPEAHRSPRDDILLLVLRLDGQALPAPAI